MKKIIVPGLLVSLVFVSCTDFFTNSWGKWAARDPASLIPNVTASNVDDLISKSENNSDLSLEVLKKINGAVGSASGSDKAKLQNAAITAAVNASNLTTTLLSSVSNISNLEDADGVKDLISTTLNKMNNLTSASDNLTGILPDPVADPTGFAAFADSASADDLALAAALILAGEVKKAGNTSIFDDYTTAPSSAAVDLAEALAVAALDKPPAEDGNTSNLLDLLGKFGFQPTPPTP